MKMRETPIRTPIGEFSANAVGGSRRHVYEIACQNHAARVAAQVVQHHPACPSLKMNVPCTCDYSRRFSEVQSSEFDKAYDESAVAFAEQLLSE